MTAGGAVPGTWSPPAARRVPPGLGGTCSPQKNRRLLHRRFSSPREASLMWGVRRGSGVAGGAGCLRVNRASGRGREVYAETSASAAKAAHGRSPWQWRSRRSRASRGRRIRRLGEAPPSPPAILRARARTARGNERTPRRRIRRLQASAEAPTRPLSCGRGPTARRGDRRAMVGCTCWGASGGTQPR